MARGFVDQDSYKAVEDIYRLLLGILIVGNAIGAALISLVNFTTGATCFAFLLAAIYARTKIDVKHGRPLCALFHANVVIVAVVSVINIGWGYHLWIIVVGTIFISYFLNFGSKPVTYCVAAIELGVLIALYLTYKDAPVNMPKTLLLTFNTMNIILIFYAVLRLSIFADVVAAKGYKQAREEKERFEELSKHDFLTGLLNRPSVEKALRYEIKMLKDRRAGSNLVVLLGDIDGFKGINDTYGHDAGDKTIKQAADTLLATFRNDDKICRWGGEEFLILMPDADADSIRKITARLTKNINFIKLPSGDSLSMTFGMLICVSGVNTNFSYVINRADELLYAGKKKGKNRIEMEILSDATTSKNNKS